MTHYRLADSTPSAIILARNPRTGSLDELKTYTGNHIFLNNGDEFQIRLFNPLSEKIGVQIGFNKQLSTSMLVLNPGEDVIVDRFLDDKRKMIFETYQYDKGNSAAVKAVANNGIVEIRFFKEYIYTPPVTTWATGVNINGTLTINGFPYSGCSSSSGIYINNVGSSTLGNSGVISTTLNGNFTDFNLSNSNSRMYDNNVFNCCTSNLTSGLDFASDFSDNFTVQEEQPQIKSSGKLRSKSIKAETGRVEKGQQSDQNFKQVEIQFQNYPFHAVVYNLKPTSEKDNYVKTEIRQYCSVCKYRIKKSSYMYCPKCGNKL